MAFPSPNTQPHTHTHTYTWHLPLAADLSGKLLVTSMGGEEWRPSIAMRSNSERLYPGGGHEVRQCYHERLLCCWDKVCSSIPTGWKARCFVQISMPYPGGGQCVWPYLLTVMGGSALLHKSKTILSHSSRDMTWRACGFAGEGHCLRAEVYAVQIR